MTLERWLFKKSFLPFEEIAFESLESTEKWKGENKNTSISLDQEVPVAGVCVWRQVSLLQGLSCCVCWQCLSSKCALS